MKKGAMNIIFGGNAGSEAKGKLAAFLAAKYGICWFAGCLSPNAGHTTIIHGKKYVTHHIPVGITGCKWPDNAWIVLGAASIINPIILEKEVEELVKEGVMEYHQLFIDSRADVITPLHVEKEDVYMTGMGSTAQGVGEARSDKVMRRGIKIKKLGEVGEGPLWETITHETNRILMRAMDNGATVLYEMGQGFDLCVDHGIDPLYCTSRNCTPMQALADMGIPPKYLGDTYAVIRPYPIRVNNRTGSSGPYPSNELNWAEVKERCGADRDITEMTTTTKLERRVFEFSDSQIKKMVRTCDPTFLCLQFANYVDWGCYGKMLPGELGEKVDKFIGKIELVTGKKVAYVGTGPEQAEMVDMGLDTGPMEM